jgi:hypothetical protein
MVNRAPTDMAWMGPATSNMSQRTPTHAAVDFDSVDAVYLLGEHFHRLCPVIPRRKRSEGTPYLEASAHSGPRVRAFEAPRIDGGSRNSG